MSKTGFRKNLFTALFSQAATFLVTFVFHLLNARVLGPTEFGIYTTLMLIPIVIARIAHLGFPDANAYFISESSTSPQKLIGNSMLLAVAFTLVSGIGIFVYGKLFETVISNDLTLQLAMTFVIGFLMFKTLVTSVFIGKDDLRFYGKVMILEALFPLIGSVSLYSLNILSPRNLVFVHLFSLFALFLMIMGRLECKLSIRWDLPLAARCLRYALKSWLMDSSNLLVYKLDILILSAISTSYYVGLYGVAVTLVEKVWYFSNSISSSLFPSVRKMDIKQAGSFTLRIARLNFLFALVTASLIGVLVKPLIHFLYGDSYIGAYKSVLLLIPGIIALSFPKVLVSYFAAHNKLEYPAMVSGVALVVNLILNILWIPTWGIEGAALASSVAYILYFFLYGRAFKHISGISPFTLRNSKAT